MDMWSWPNKTPQMLLQNTKEILQLITRDTLQFIHLELFAVITGL